jgi:hypothetical protein
VTELNLDVLFAIAEAGPVLDKVEQSLRAGGKDKLADQIVKLQQDVGLEIAHEMTGAPLTGPGEGPESARLRAAYEPVTAARLRVLPECLGQLPAGDVKTALAGIVKQLSVPESAPARQPAPGAK